MIPTNEVSPDPRPALGVSAPVDFGREICGILPAAESREWLCTNGLGGFASGTVAGLLTRRYHGILTAALRPPLGRTLLVAKVEEQVRYAGLVQPLSSNRWADGTVDPHGYQAIESFRLEGTCPVWIYACGDALLEKRIWMEQGANTTYVRYRLLRGREPAELELKVLVNYREFHGATRGAGWRMGVDPVPGGLRVRAFEQARPLLLLAEQADVQPAHEWYVGFDLAAERARGLEACEDHLHVGTFRARLAPDRPLTLVCSAEESAPEAAEAWERHQRYEASLLAAWRMASPTARQAPEWVRQLVLAADQFVVGRPLPEEPHGLSIIAGYPWFGDWGRDTMISLPGLLLATGRAPDARRILTTFAPFVDQGMLPNRFPEAGQPPEYTSVDAALWYFQAIRAYYQATGDDALLATLRPVLDEILHRYLAGTRYGIGVDSADGLLRAGEPGVQLTWMDAKIGDWVVTPRTGKAVEINALWYNALRVMAACDRCLGRPAEEWEGAAERVRAGFERFWDEAGAFCYDVIDGPDGVDAALRPNQILAVSLPDSPLPPDRQRRIVEACASHLLTSFGLRSLGPTHPSYRGRYAGGPRERDSAYHQGPAWGWLLGPFALAHFRVYRDPEAALAFLAPLTHHLADYGLGSVAELFDGDPPFLPRGCVAQAWSVGEALRAWTAIAGERREGGS